MDIKELENRIWSTRKCRINASERLIRNDKFLHFCNMYYSCFLTVVSIMQLKFDYENMEIFSVCLSVALLVILAYFNSQKYIERANNFKNNYIELQELYDLVTKNHNNELDDILKKYYQLLNDCENHATIDYLTFLFNDNRLHLKKEIVLNKDENLVKYNLQFLLFLILKGTVFLFKASIILIPTIIFINTYLFKIW